MVCQGLVALQCASTLDKLWADEYAPASTAIRTKAQKSLSKGIKSVTQNKKSVFILRKEAHHMKNLIFFHLESKIAPWKE